MSPLTRYATAYRRRVFIDLFLQQWDEDKYANLGTMLFNNYNQAIGIVRDDSIALADGLRSLGVRIEDLIAWEAEEVAYFKTLGRESEWDVHATAYVELLQELRDLEYVLSYLRMLITN